MSFYTKIASTFSHVTVTATLFLSILPAHAEVDILWQAKAGKEQINLVELYTSQGCHSCPPAERLLNQLDAEQGLWTKVIPLAFHVDYWNYIGWKDPFSQAKYSNRQRFHKVLGNVRSVYTPGWLVNGQEWRGFFRRQAIPQKTSATTAPLVATINDHNTNLININIPVKAEQTDSIALIYIAILGSGYSDKITAGENNGRTLQSNFTVLKLTEHHVRPNVRWQIPLAKATEPQTSQKAALVIWLSDQNQRPIQAIGNWIDRQLVINNL